MSEDTILYTDTTTSYLWNPCMGKCKLYCTSQNYLTTEKSNKNCEIQSTHHTRQHNQISIERCNSTVASKLPYYTFPILWNKWAKSLPASKCQVKSQMRSTILASYAESVKCSNDHCRDCKN